MENSQEITVKTYKYDGKLHRSWKAGLVERKDDLLILLGVFDQKIEHSELGTIHPGTVSYEYYWLGRWYNIFRFHEPGGSLRNYYCNINMPPKLEGDILSYVDLDIDVFVSKNFELEVWDEDEFEENSKLLSYPQELFSKVDETLRELKFMVAEKAFPFSAG